MAASDATGCGRKVTCFVVLLLCGLTAQAAAQEVIEIGALLPLTGVGCVSGVQFRHAAEVALSYVQSQSWWTVTNMSLQLNVMSSNSSYSSWADAEDFTRNACTSGTACSRVAMIGPYTSDGTAHVEFVARDQQVPVISFSATSPLLSGQAFFTRLCPSDTEGARSLFKLIKKFAWDQIAVIHVNNEYARAYELELQELVQNDKDLTITQTSRFETGNAEQVRDALKAIDDSLTRVVVAITYDSDIALVFEEASKRGMLGKGWTWLGTEWLAEPTFAYSADPAALRKRADGSIGTLPAAGKLAEFQDGVLASYAVTAQDKIDCPALTNGPNPAPPAPYIAYVFDSILAVAATAAALRDCSSPGVCANSFASVTGNAVHSAMLTTTIPNSPLTGPIEFTSQGERLLEDTTFDLVNLQGDEVVLVGERSGSSDWRMIRTIIWPGGSTEVPSDRALPEIGTVAAFFSIALFAVVVSMALGHCVQQVDVLAWFPSSGVVVLVGIIIGVIVTQATTDLSDDFEKSIKFDTQFFSLVFLPIIIFQSGYALKKHPFFSQLGSILLIATVGTLISTLLTGSLLFYLGQADAVVRMSIEEALAFGALIAAVDPVSTLAQFGSLSVPLSLGALVYGESVINDAIAIVLYRTFTGFLTEEVTTSALLLAVLAVFGILIFSTIIGFVVAILAGFTIRKLKLGAARHASVAETVLLIVFSYASFTITEALHLSGIVASLACGIAMNHYVKKVLSKEGVELAGATFMVMADIAETIVFLQVGLNVPLFAHVFSFPLVAFTLAACLFSRVVNVFPLSWLLNLGRKERIPCSHQTILWLSGLRGAIAYALAVQFPSHLVEEVSNTTAIIVVFTILVLGGSTRPALRALKVEREVKKLTHKQELAMNRKAQASSKCKSLMARFDARVIRRIVQGDAIANKSPHNMKALHSPLEDTNSNSDGDGDTKVLNPTNRATPDAVQLEMGQHHRARSAEAKDDDAATRA